MLLWLFHFFFHSGHPIIYTWQWSDWIFLEHYIKWFHHYIIQKLTSKTSVQMAINLRLHKLYVWYLENSMNNLNTLDDLIKLTAAKSKMPYCYAEGFMQSYLVSGTSSIYMQESSPCVWTYEKKEWDSSIQQINALLPQWHAFCTNPLISGPWFNIKVSSYQYRKSYCGDKTILWLAYLHNGISYTDKTAYLYWFSPQSSIYPSSQPT